MLYIVSFPEKEFTENEQRKAIKNIKQAAVFGIEDIGQMAKLILADI